jgi:leucine dehydrogenase
MRIPETLGLTARRRPAAVAPVTPPAAPQPPVLELDHEELLVRKGARSGAEVIVAVHSTALGPALGGLRMWPYATAVEGVADALRLARGMTYKAAAAGLDLGGGKGVIRVPSGNGSLRPELRRAMLLDFADAVESLDGRYITAEDVGTGPEDMVVIAERTPRVTGMPPERGGSGDPSPFTAMGVEAAIRACVAHRRGDSDLRGLGIVVLGLGHVGSRLARRLAVAGARLSVSDVDRGKRALAEQLDARWVEPEEALGTPCDVLAPCALGGLIDRRAIRALRAEIVCGAANNQLASESLAGELAGRGILYAPDFIANAGGLINVYRELRGYDEDWAREHAGGIEQTLDRILATADARGLTPLTAAYEVARERLDAALRN